MDKKLKKKIKEEANDTFEVFEDGDIPILEKRTKEKKIKK